MAVKNQNDVYKLAQTLLAKHKENREDTIEEAVELILSDPGPYETFIRPLLITAITSIINNIAGQRRSALKIAATRAPFEFEEDTDNCCACPEPKSNYVPTLPKGVSGETLSKINPEVLASAAELRFLDGWQLNKVKKHLGDATREDLEIEIDMYLVKAAGHDKVREFLTRIHDELAPGQKVREVFSDDRAAKLYKSSHDKIEAKWSVFKNPIGAVAAG